MKEGGNGDRRLSWVTFLFFLLGFRRALESNVDFYVFILGRGIRWRTWLGVRLGFTRRLFWCGGIFVRIR